MAPKPSPITALPQTKIQGQIIHIPNESSPKKSILSTPNPFEKRFGYHRAIRRGPFIFVSGTTALKDVDSPDTTTPAATTSTEDSDDESTVLYPGSAKKQAHICMERCVDAVTRLGGAREDVVRVRMYVSKYEDTIKVGEAFRDCFGAKKDGVERGDEREGDVVAVTATMIVCKDAFVDPDILVEVEIDAVLV